MKFTRVCAVVTASAMLTVGVAPAMAATNTMKDGKCTIALTTAEKKPLDDAKAKTNTAASYVNYLNARTIAPSEAADAKAAVEKAVDELENQKSLWAANDAVESDEVMANNVAVANAALAVTEDYVKAIEACGKSEKYPAPKQEEPGDSDKDDANTSSNMNQESLNLLIGLAGGAVGLGVIYYVFEMAKEQGLLKGIKLPF